MGSIQIDVRPPSASTDINNNRTKALLALRPPHQLQLLEPDGHRRIRDTELLGQ